MMPAMKNKDIRSWLRYDPATGVFVWLRSRGRVPAGAVAGRMARTKRSKTEYIEIGFDGKKLKAHRLAFLFMNGVMPTEEVDHINGDGTDNRWANLREVACAENKRNLPITHKNKTGVVGVSLRKRGGYMSRIGGSFILQSNDFFEAVCARKSAELDYGYHENHGRQIND